MSGRERGWISFIERGYPKHVSVSDAAGFPSARTALLTTHFGDPRWVELLLRRVRSVFPELSDENIFVIDQDRTATSADALRARLGPVRILRYPVSAPHVVMTGHDHAHVLNLAVREIASDYLLIFDSDAHPVLPEARERLMLLVERSDAVLAALDRDGTRTHPCFMLFGPAIDRERLFFDEGQLEVGVDTGRMSFDQVEAMGLRAELLRPTPAFGGRWGTFYLDGSIYHHGSGSFASNPDPRLQAQADYRRREHDFYGRRVFRGRYALSAPELYAARALEARKLRPTRLSASLRRRLGRGARGRTTD